MPISTSYFLDGSAKPCGCQRNSPVQIFTIALSPWHWQAYIRHLVRVASGGQASKGDIPPIVTRVGKEGLRVGRPLLLGAGCPLLT